MTESPSCYFTPKSGSISAIIFPHSLKYLGSCVSDPDASEVTFMRDVSIEEIDPPEEYANLEDSDEDVQSEGEDDDENEGEEDEEESENEKESEDEKQQDSEED